MKNSNRGLSTSFDTILNPKCLYLKCLSWLSVNRVHLTLVMHLLLPWHPYPVVVQDDSAAIINPVRINPQKNSLILFTNFMLINLS